MIGPKVSLQGLATEYHLPKSNHAWRLAIRHEIETATGNLDRRAIPADASESFWAAADGHAIRRIDWGTDRDAGPGAAQARGSILFFPGRGDHYEKYLETLDEWHRDRKSVVSGQSGYVRVALGGRRILKKKKKVK